MRNDLDRETYNWLFKIFTFFAAVLGIVCFYLIFNGSGFSPKTIKVASSLFFILCGVFLYIRIEFLKLYKTETYKSKRLPMWISACLAFVVGLIRLF